MNMVSTSVVSTGVTRLNAEEKQDRANRCLRSPRICIHHQVPIVNLDIKAVIVGRFTAPRRGNQGYTVVVCLKHIY